MNPEQFEPVVLEALIRKEKTWVYPWIGVLFGGVVGILIGHHLSMLVNEFYNFINAGTPITTSRNLSGTTGGGEHSFGSDG